MSDLTPPGAVGRFLANGGGAVTFRVLSTALAVLLLALVRYEGEQLMARLDKIEAAATAGEQKAQMALDRADVHAARLDTLDASNIALWSAMHGNSVRLDDHEHRISIIEGARQRR